MIGLMRGMKCRSYQSRPLRFSPILRVRKPAASGMPRKIRTVRATSQMPTSKPCVSRPSQPGNTVK